MLSKSDIDEISREIIGAAIEVHKEIGPGLIEGVYHSCMKYELSLRSLGFKSEVPTVVEFKGIKLDADLRCDLVVEELVSVELKSVKKLVPVNDAQLLTYMRLLETPKGVLINFNCTNIFKFGQKTFVNDSYAKLPS